MPEEIRGRDSQRFARFPDLNPHYTCRNRAGRLIFACDGHRASLDSVLNKSVSVSLGPVDREKERAWPHLPGIASYLANFRTARTRGQRCLHAFEHFVQFSSAIHGTCACRALSLPLPASDMLQDCCQPERDPAPIENKPPLPRASSFQRSPALECRHLHPPPLSRKACEVCLHSDLTRRTPRAVGQAVPRSPPE